MSPASSKRVRAEAKEQWREYIVGYRERARSENGAGVPSFLEHLIVCRPGL